VKSKSFMRKKEPSLRRGESEEKKEKGRCHRMSHETALVVRNQKRLKSKTEQRGGASAKLGGEKRKTNIRG